MLKTSEGLFWDISGGGAHSTQFHYHSESCKGGFFKKGLGEGGRGEVIYSLELALWDITRGENIPTFQFWALELLGHRVIKKEKGGRRRGERRHEVLVLGACSWGEREGRLDRILGKV